MNMGSVEARFNAGDKVKIYLGERYVGEGQVIEEHVPEGWTTKYCYTVTMVDDDGSVIDPEASGIYFCDELLMPATMPESVAESVAESVQ